MSDRSLQQLTAGLAALSFLGALILLLFANLGAGSRLIPAGTLFGLLMLSLSIWIGTLDDGRRE